MSGRARAQRRDHGQVLVLFALSIVVLLAGAGLAFDIGRFYSERRFLQNAADAAARAAANALIRGESNANADAEARSVLSRNFLGSPSGVAPALPPTTPVYASGHAGEPDYLVNGILISGCEVRVAIQNQVDYTFGRAVGLGASDIGAQARTKCGGDLLPIAVRRYVNAPGPNNGAISPCPDDQTQFMDFFATADTACLGTETDSALRTAPSADPPFNTANPGADTTSHGPVVAILGQGAQPGNGADFRGFIALDIRNFATDTSQAYYNQVTSGTQPNVLKDMQAAYFAAGGYPGPDLPPATTPPDPWDQVAIMSGNSTGIAIDALNTKYGPGDEILVAIYPGQVMAIPDFTLDPPDLISLPESGTTANAGTLKVGRNQAFSGQVTLSTLADTLDAANPMVLGTLVGADPITYTPNPVTPSLGSGTNVAMTNLVTGGATPGVYALWIRGQAGSPYLTTKLEPIAIKVGTVTRDFTITADAQSKDATNVGDAVSFNLTLQNAPNKNTNFGNPVSLSVDGPLPTGVGAVTLGSATVTPSKNGNSTTLTINTGTLAPGEYRFIVRATGTNADSTPRSVTHLLALTVNVAPSSSNNDEYVDIVGFAVMRIATADSNTVTAYAITPVIADMNDERLRRGQVARLVPWN
jgi:hypothetical protein